MKMTELDFSSVLLGDESLRKGRNISDDLIENFLKKHNIEKVRKEYARNCDEPSRGEVAIIKLGKEYREKSSSDEAERAFKRTIEKNPKHSNIYVALGRTYRIEGKLDLAEENVKQAIELDQRNVNAYIALAGIYLDKERFMEAKEVLLLALSLGAQDPRREIYGHILDCQQVITWGEIEEIYRKHGIFVKLSPHILAMNIRNDLPQRKIDKVIKEMKKVDGETIKKENYNRIYKILKKRGIRYVAMNYPTRDIGELKEILNGDEDIIFVSNEENFKKALEIGEYREYFIDRCYDDFGHGTAKGNGLIAENVAVAILRELRK